MKIDRTTIKNMMEEIDFILKNPLLSSPVRQSAERLQFLINGLREPPVLFKDLEKTLYVKQMKQEGYCILRVRYDTHCKKCGLPIVAGSKTYPSYALWHRDDGVICAKSCKEAVCISSDTL